ncbi:hypothetical protein ASE75_10715 [Sphingomonas sp. Leaf17]|nr:hypothetical protein ASE75_10715 [Sphingomonas sp. Leaf17]
MFGDSAARLAGFAGAVLGWSPDGFWAATPAELAVVVTAMTESRGVGDGMTAPPDAAAIMKLREAFPDG